MTSLVRKKKNGGTSRQTTKSGKKGRPSNLHILKPTEYTKAQKMYMKLCNNSKVRPDTEFVNHLPDQVLYFPNLDNAGEKEIDIVGILTSRMTKTKHIKYGCIVPNNSQGDGMGGRKRVALPGQEDIPIHVATSCLKLCKTIQRCVNASKQLLCLELAGIHLRPDSLRVLGKGIIESVSLKRLNLGRCQLNDDGMNIINKALVDSKSLNDIDLSGNNLHDSSASAIAALIRRHSARRDDEYWASCLRSGGEEGLVPRGPNPSDAEINVQLKGLVALDVSGNEFTDKCLGGISLDGTIGMGPLGQVLSRDDWLVAFNFLDNNITETGASVLKKALEENESLAAIDFRPKPTVPSELLDSDHGKVRPTLQGELPKPILHQLGRRDPKTASWMMTRIPKKGMVSTHETIHKILARWGWFGLREGELAEKALVPGNKTKHRKKQRSAKSNENNKASINTSTTRMKRNRLSSKKNVSKATASSARKSRSSESTTTTTRRKRTAKKKRSARVASKVNVTIPRPKSAPSGDMSLNTSSIGGNSNRGRVPKSKLERADIAAARINGSAQQRPKTARGARPKYTREQRKQAFGLESPSAFNVSTRPPQIDTVDLRLSSEGIDALRSIFRRVVMSNSDVDEFDESEEPTAPFKDLVAELERDANASALLNIPGSTPRNSSSVRTLNARRMTWSMLLQFFSERAEKATIISKSPRKKSTNQVNFPNSPRVFVDGVEEGNELEVLSMLEGWVAQMHDFIDKAEENPSLLNSARKEKKSSKHKTKKEASTTTPNKDNETIAAAMSPDEVRDAIASRLKDMFDV
jgi:hypothetical protein